MIQVFFLERLLSDCHLILRKGTFRDSKRKKKVVCPWGLWMRTCKQLKIWVKGPSTLSCCTRSCVVFPGIVEVVWDWKDGPGVKRSAAIFHKTSTREQGERQKTYVYRIRTCTHTQTRRLCLEFHEFVETWVEATSFSSKNRRSKASSRQN